jgi:hypothetical protein
MHYPPPVTAPFALATYVYEEMALQMSPQQIALWNSIDTTGLSLLLSLVVAAPAAAEDP